MAGDDPLFSSGWSAPRCKCRDALNTTWPSRLPGCFLRRGLGAQGDCCITRGCPHSLVSCGCLAAMPLGRFLRRHCRSFWTQRTAAPRPQLLQAHARSGTCAGAANDRKVPQSRRIRMAINSQLCGTFRSFAATANLTLLLIGGSTSRAKSGSSPQARTHPGPTPKADIPPGSSRRTRSDRH